MATDIIHIGYHKTGTTWFQKRFYPFVESHRYIDRKMVQQGILNPSAFKFNPKECSRILNLQQNHKPVAICEEELSGNVHSGGLRGFQSKETALRIKALFPHGHIVIFIRNQVDMAAALYRHYIREGGTYGPKRYFFPDRFRKDVARHPFKYPLFSLDHLEYVGLIRHYQELFRKSRVSIFLFEQFKEDPKGFVQEFGSMLDLAFDPERLSWSSENRGYGRNAVWLGRFLNFFSYRSVLDKHYVLRLTSNKVRSNLPRFINKTPLRGKEQGSEEILGKKIVDFLKRRFALTNMELARLCDLPLEYFGYPMP